MNDFAGIEKIKIIGSTFMAACGLISGRKGSLESEEQESHSRGQNARTLARSVSEGGMRSFYFTLCTFDIVLDCY